MELAKTPGGIWVPGGAAPRRRSPAAVISYGSGRRNTVVRIFYLEFWREDGMINWENTDTGKYDAMFPDKALETIRDMAKHMLGKNVESSICFDATERNNLLEAFRAIENMAKEAMPDAPPRSVLEGLFE